MRRSKASLLPSNEEVIFGMKLGDRFLPSITPIVTKGDTVHVTAEPPSSRKIHHHSQVYAPNTDQHRLHPLYFAENVDKSIYSLVEMMVFTSRHWNEHDELEVICTLANRIHGQQLLMSN